MPQKTQVIFQVQRRNGEDEDPSTIGKLSLGEGGKLTLVESDSAFTSALQNIIDAVNGQKTLRVKSAAPPGANPTAIMWRTVDRDNPDLPMALAEYLEQKYDLYLAPDDAS